MLLAAIVGLLTVSATVLLHAGGTLGYGDITLETPWRLLTGVESLNGVILIGWSTALSFAVIQGVWKRMELGREET